MIKVLMIIFFSVLLPCVSYAKSDLEILRYKCGECNAIAIFDHKIALSNSSKEAREIRSKMNRRLDVINKNLRKKEKKKFKEKYEHNKSKPLTLEGCKILLSSTGRCKADEIIKPKKVKYIDQRKGY